MHRCAKFQVCRYARFGDISEGLLNFIGVTWPRPCPFTEILIGHFGEIVRMHPWAKFLVCSFIRFRDMFEGVPNFIRVTWPRPPPFINFSIFFWCCHQWQLSLHLTHLFTHLAHDTAAAVCQFCPYMFWPMYLLRLCINCCTYAPWMPLITVL